MAIWDAELRTRPPDRALLAVARMVAGGAPQDALFAAVCGEVANATGAAATSILRYAGDERAVAVGAWREGGSRGVPVNAELDFDAGNSALGRVRATRRPARADSYEGVGGNLPAVMRAVGLRATVAAPIMLAGDVWGAIVASTAGEQPLPDGTEQGLAEFAALVALAVVNAQERARVAASGVRLVEAADASRRRLERELHEGPHQHLVALALKLRVARSQAHPELVPLLDDALADARATTAALRGLSHELHPAMLDERGLSAAMLALAARSQVPVHLRELPGRRFAPSLENTVYLVVAEALAEARAHGASEAGVRIGDRGDHVRVKVTDDGAPDGRPGPAVCELVERVAALGGVLGTSGGAVRATLPT